jgi:hypothetical protein
MRRALRAVGIDADKECEWVYDPVFSYGNSPEQVAMLERGEIHAISTQPPYTERLIQQGLAVLVDPYERYPLGRPDKVIVATGKVVEHRSEELEAFLRANIRAFWTLRDPAEYRYLQDLEIRLREKSHNDEERKLRIITSIEKIEGWTVPIHGMLAIEADKSEETLEQVVEELVQIGELAGPVRADRVLRLDAARNAHEALRARPQLAEAWQRAAEVRAKYGY